MTAQVMHVSEEMARDTIAAMYALSEDQKADLLRKWLRGDQEARDTVVHQRRLRFYFGEQAKAMRP
jgi:hypothetical protein